MKGSIMEKIRVNFSRSELLYLRDLYESVNGVITVSQFLAKHGEGKITIGDFAKKFEGVNLHCIEGLYISDGFDGRELMFLSAMAIICNVHLLIANGTIPETERPIQSLSKMGFSRVKDVTDIYLKINEMLKDRIDNTNAEKVIERAAIEQARLDIRSN